MNTVACPSPLDWNTLLAYWLGELDPDAEARTEEHYLGCAACSQRLEDLAALAQGVRALTQASGVDAVVSADFVRRLNERGLRVREYRVPRNGSVNCTVAPDDDFVVAHLAAPLADVVRLDAIYLNNDDGNETRHADIPFDPDSGSVTISTRIVALRALPATTQRIRLLAVTDHSERILGEYTFKHTPYRSAESEKPD